MEALCEDYGELGRALSHFARFEEALAARQGQYTTAGSTAVQRGADLQKLGYGALRQHSLSKQVRQKLCRQRHHSVCWLCVAPACFEPIDQHNADVAPGPSDGLVSCNCQPVHQLPPTLSRSS